MAAPGPVQVYLKVLEARGIVGVEKNGNSDGMVEVWIGKERKNHLQTKHFDDSLTPQNVHSGPTNKWHEEFLFFLSSAAEVISLRLVDHNRILKNEPLGNAEIDVARIVPGVGVDMWLPLNTKGEIRVFVTATPLIFSPPKPKSERLHSLRLLLERTNYFPGETVRGAVIFNVGVPKKIRGVRVRFTGESRVHWSESHGKNNTVSYFAVVVFFNPTATLYGNPRGIRDSLMIPSGGYYWPIELTMPTRLAPSFEASVIGKNQYFVTAYVDIPMAVDKTVIQHFNVSVQYAQLQPTMTTIIEPKAKALLASDQNISASLRGGTIGYLGENFPIDIEIVNNGTKPVKELILQLTGIYYFTARHLDFWKTRFYKVLVIKQLLTGITSFPLMPGNRWAGQVQVMIPDQIPPSVPKDISPIIQVLYYFKVTMNTSGNVFTKASNNEKLPVLIGRRFATVPQPLAAAAPTSIIQVAHPPQNVFQYLAPAPPVSATAEYVGQGQIPDHDQFAAAAPFQPEQWVEVEPHTHDWASVEQIKPYMVQKDPLQH